MLKKASKRLVCAIIALVASVLLCIGVCLAWFAANSEVRGDGLQTNLRGADIVDFKVTAYYLDEGKTNGIGTGIYTVANGNAKDENDKPLILDGAGNQLTVDFNDDCIINSIDESRKDVMRPYSLSNAYTTAVLFKIKYTLAGDVDTNKNFRIFAECPDTSRIKVEKVSGADSFKSSLSNAVKFANAGTDGTSENITQNSFTTVSDVFPFAFTNLQHEKEFHINFYEGINAAYCTANGAKNADGDFVGTEYVIMDYGSDRFAYLASLLLESGGGLNSGLQLLGDITLGMEEYIEDVAVEPVSIEVDKGAYVDSDGTFNEAAFNTAYTQPMGEDIMSHKWQFVVTYSDGTKKVVVSSNANLKKGTVDTQTVGNNTATVEYTENGKTVSCEVPYTIGIVIMGGTGVAKGDTLNLDVVGLEEANVTWSVDNTSVATIDAETGVLTGVEEGTVVVTATATVTGSDNTTTTLTATSVITVTAEKVSVTGVTLSTTTLEMTEGDTQTLTATVSPDNATNKSVTWVSGDTAVATVDSNGTVKAVGAGETTITATTVDGGKTASCTVNVTAAPVNVESVTLNKTSSTLKIGATETLTATVSPAEAVNKTVTWSSSKSSVATVDGDGKVTAVGIGTATITATAGGKTATCEITVEKVGVTSVTVSGETEVTAGQKITLSATVKPDNATYKTVSWAVTNGTGTATIDASTGELTGGTAGTVTVVATADGIHSEAYTVTVKELDYTTGTHTLNLTGDSDIFTGTKVSSDGGYNTTYFKLGGGDILHVTMKLQAGKVIKVTGKAVPANTAKNSSLKLAKGDGTTGAVDSYGEQLVVSGATATDINYTLNVTKEGTIVLDITRGTETGTGCDITALTIQILDAAPETYTVTWKNGDTVLETDNNVAVGTTPTYDGAEPTKAATAQYTYTFSGWSPAVGTITGDTTYTAQFTETVRTYTVTWKNDDGTVLETDENVEYGATPEYNGAEPAKAEDAQYTYTFSGWSPAVGAITGDTTYTAQFTETAKEPDPTPTTIVFNPQTDSLAGNGNEIKITNGSHKSSSPEVTINGTTIAAGNALKIDSKVTIEIEVSVNSTLTLYINQSSMKISYGTTTNEVITGSSSGDYYVVTKELAANTTYKIVRDSSETQLFMLTLTPTA